MKFLNWLKNIRMFKRAVVLLFFTVTLFTLWAQDPNQPVINFKQRIIQRRHDEEEKIDSNRVLHLMIAGNIYQTERHVHYAYDTDKKKYDFRNEFRYVQPLLNLGDISIANLKTSFSDKVDDMFSVPDEFALALKHSGINVVMNANVHTANIDKNSMKRTTGVLDDFDIYHTGCYTDIKQRGGNYPLIINKKGFRIAVLNYTNLFKRPAVSREFMINEIDKTTIERDMRMAKANKPDFIIAYFDWGTVTQEIPSYAQQELAQYIFQQGANLVVGAVPNAPMRLDFMNYFYEGSSREGLVAFSLGNLISGNEEPKNRNGYLIDMELHKNNFTGETKIGDWGVIPVYTYYDTTSVRGKTKVYSVPCSAVEAGDVMANIPYIEKRRAVNSAYEVRKLLGSTADEIQYNLNEMVVNNVEETMDITNASLNNKFSLKRPDDIKPTAAPVLPFTSPKSKNPPSLAALYEDSVVIVSSRKSTEISYLNHKEIPKPVENKKEKTEEQEKIASASASEISTNNSSLQNITAVNEKKSAVQSDTFYRIQFYALKTILPLDTNYYTHLKGFEILEENGMYKYLLGKYKNFDECEKFWKNQIRPRYKQSFIVKYIDGKRVFE
jgi:poly-gamma-glutamate synthesis protein (capsule biosynthesis protein)